MGKRTPFSVTTKSLGGSIKTAGVVEPENKVAQLLIKTGVAKSNNNLFIGFLLSKLDGSPGIVNPNLVVNEISA